MICSALVHFTLHFTRTLRLDTNLKFKISLSFWDVYFFSRKMSGPIRDKNA